MRELHIPSLPGWNELPDIGLYMDQVVTYLSRTFQSTLPKGEITKAMVNNYVKFGLVARPVKKKYDRTHMATLLILCVLKQALNMENIRGILNLLFKDGIEDGYARFCSAVAVLEEAASAGEFSLQWTEETTTEQIVMMGIMAAVYTVETHWMLQRADPSPKEKTR